jgi:polyhydroxyalkanoate synthesis regulator phasin
MASEGKRTYFAQSAKKAIDNLIERGEIIEGTKAIDLITNQSNNKDYVEIRKQPLTETNIDKINNYITVRLQQKSDEQAQQQHGGSSEPSASKKQRSSGKTSCKKLLRSYTQF